MCELISLSPAYYYSRRRICLPYVALTGSLLWFDAVTNSVAFHLYECQYVSLILSVKKKIPKSYKIAKSHFSHLIILDL